MLESVYWTVLIGLQVACLPVALLHWAHRIQQIKVTSRTRRSAPLSNTSHGRATLLFAQIDVPTRAPRKYTCRMDSNGHEV